MVDPGGDRVEPGPQLDAGGGSAGGRVPRPFQAADRTERGAGCRVAVGGDLQVGVDLSPAPALARGTGGSGSPLRSGRRRAVAGGMPVEPGLLRPWCRVPGLQRQRRVTRRRDGWVSRRWRCPAGRCGEIGSGRRVAASTAARVRAPRGVWWSRAASTLALAAAWAASRARPGLPSMARVRRTINGLAFSATMRACRSGSSRISSGRRIGSSVAVWEVPVLIRAGAVGVGGAGDPGGADQLGHFPVERAVFAAAEEGDDVGQPEQGPGFVLAVADHQLPPGLRGVDERQPEGAFVGHPGAQRRQRGGGRQFVQARQKRRAQPSVRAGVRQLQGGVQDVFGDRGHQRGRRRVRVVAAQQVDGAAAGDQLGQVHRRAGPGRGRTGRVGTVGRTTRGPAGWW